MEQEPGIPAEPRPGTLARQALPCVVRWLDMAWQGQRKRYKDAREAWLPAQREAEAAWIAHDAEDWRNRALYERWRCANRQEQEVEWQKDSERGVVSQIARLHGALRCL